MSWINANSLPSLEWPLAMHTWMRRETLTATCARLVTQGCQAVAFGPEVETDDPAAVREVLNAHGLGMVSVGAAMFGTRGFMASDALAVDETVEYVVRAIGFAAEAGGSVVTIVPATIGLLEPPAERSRAWRLCVDGLRRCADSAARHGIRIAIEPINRFETFFVQRCEQARELAESVGENCGVCLDVFHMNIEEPDLEGAIAMAGLRLFDVHIADSNRLAPGLGAVDWRHFLSALKRSQYRGSLTLEYVTPPQAVHWGTSNDLICGSMETDTGQYAHALRIAVDTLCHAAEPVKSNETARS